MGLERARSCTGKVRFRTIGRAEYARQKAIRQGAAAGGYLAVYRCLFGKHYHIGHGPGPGQARRAAEAAPEADIDDDDDLAGEGATYDAKQGATPRAGLESARRPGHADHRHPGQPGQRQD